MQAKRILNVNHEDYELARNGNELTITKTANPKFKVPESVVKGIKEYINWPYDFNNWQNSG